MSAYDSEEAFDRLMRDMQVLYTLKAGQVATQTDVDALNRLDAHYREEDERATDAYSRGFQDGLRHSGGDALVAAVDRADSARSDAAVAKAMNNFARRIAFAEGAAACRETMARFVEQGGDRVTAQSIRLNWSPSWGPEPAEESALRASPQTPPNSDVGQPNSPPKAT